jgi:hypothetical protein
VKKLLVFIIVSIPLILVAQDNKPLSRSEKKAQRNERINQLIKQEEEGALIYQKQGLFGLKMNTDGWNFIYEHGKYKSIVNTSLWWMELGERKDIKQEKLTKGSVILPGLAIGNPFVYGKQNNFYYFKLGFGKQYLIGGKGNKNGVAVSAIYGGGLSLGMLKPYYIQVEDPVNGTVSDIKYTNNDSTFLDPNVILGASAFGKGFSEMKYVPGAHIRTGLRFDYGRYNEILSAIEVGLNLEYYSEKMPIMVLNEPHHAFLNAYIAIEFGRRK